MTNERRVCLCAFWHDTAISVCLALRKYAVTIRLKAGYTAALPLFLESQISNISFHRPSSYHIYQKQLIQNCKLNE
jgi:hypothetical protein